MSSPSIFSISIYYLFVWLLLSSIRHKKKAIIFSLIIVGTVYAWERVISTEPHLLRLTFLDVGQGNSTVIQLPDKQNFLINSGEKWGNFDSGEYVVLPFLNKNGITEIDKFILTDNDSENLNSAKSLSENVKIGEVLMPDFGDSAQKTDEDFVKNRSNKLISLDSIKEISVENPATGGDGKNQVRISFFDYPNTKKSSSTSGGKIVKISYKDVDFCLLDGIKSADLWMHSQFDSGFMWEKLKNCEVLVMSELWDYEDIKDLIEKMSPQKIIFTRHYFRYQKDKIPTLMALEFPRIEYHRILENGAIICKTDGKNVDFDFTIQDEP
jgi:beta-lactamase superfamily II metal-dependent hydrolase